MSRNSWRCCQTQHIVCGHLGNSKKSCYRHRGNYGFINYDAVGFDLVEIYIQSRSDAWDSVSIHGKIFLIARKIFSGLARPHKGSC